MTILSMASPALKVCFERLGRPEVANLPTLIKEPGAGAVIVSNHVGWADSLWMAYAIYPRPLRFISKQELFRTQITKWVFEQSGCIAINRGDPSPSSIKVAVDLLRKGEILLIFPSGTRRSENEVFKRGAATIALHAQVPIVPAYYRGPSHMHVAHLVDRPRVEILFGGVIPTEGLGASKESAVALTEKLKSAIFALSKVDQLRKSAA